MEYREIEGPIEGYKMVNNDLTCRGFQFEINKRVVLGNDGPLALCENGFHFCKHPSGVWAYYSSGRIFKVRAWRVLEAPVTPGSDHKLVCREIELLEEVTPGGNQNTGNQNTGNRNTGYQNTGNQNTGNRNTGYQNTGNRNTGNWNTGNWNTGDQNTGDRNTGNWNCGNRHAGYFGLGNAPLFFFGEPTEVGLDAIDWQACHKLGDSLAADDDFDTSPFLHIPNATDKKIRELHAAFIRARKEKK